MTTPAPRLRRVLDQPDGGRRIRDNDMEQVGVYVLAALLLPLLRRAPHRVELDVPFRRAWMTAARRLGQNGGCLQGRTPVRWSSASMC